MPDLTTLLSNFLTQLYAGTWSFASFTASLFRADDGTGPAPSIAFTTEPTLGLYRAGSAALGLSGALIASGPITAGTDLTVGAGASMLRLGGRVRMRTPADGQLTVVNNAETAGVGLDVATDSVFKVRNRALTAGAAVDLKQQTAPVGLAGSLRLYAQDNGGGKTQLMVIFPSGAAIQIAIEA